MRPPASLRVGSGPHQPAPAVLSTSLAVRDWVCWGHWQKESKRNLKTLVLWNKHSGQQCHHKLCSRLWPVPVTTGDMESPCCVRRFPGTKVRPPQPVLCRRASASSDPPQRFSWAPRRALIPQGTWVPGSREAGSPQWSEETWASFLLSSAEMAVTHPKAVSSNISAWGAGNPDKWSVLFEEADGKLSSRESNFNYRCKLKLFSLVLLMKK